MKIRFGSRVYSKIRLQSDKYSFLAGTHFDKEIEWAKRWESLCLSISIQFLLP